MCGFCGFLEPQHARTADELATIAGAMADRLRHRGPDGHGTWTDAPAGLALGHRRLAIIDVSRQGHQPMVSASGRWVIAYNGEAYNFAAMRKELDAPVPAVRWHGHSDTEVLIEAIEAWGVRGAVERVNGMFAFAAWDREARTLSLARDRAGEKPLYYGWNNGAFFFSSELKAFAAHPCWSPQHDRGAFALFMRLGYIPTPWSAYAGIAKLPAGTLLTLTADDMAAGTMPEPEAFWDPAAVVADAMQHPFAGSEDDAAKELDALMRDAVRLRMVSDVPLGAFLSGGIDSTAIVAMMQAQSTRPVQTFTIGFHDADYDEAVSAKLVAAQLGTDHTALYVKPDDARAVIPMLPTMFDEPFADASQIPTYLVASLARQSVTVALSGDGGDELFAGYTRHRNAEEVWPRVSRIPAAARHGLAAIMHGVSESTWDAVLDRLAPVLPSVLKRHDGGRFLHRVADVLAAESADAFYLGLVSQETNPASLVGAQEPHTWLDSPSRWPALPNIATRMMFLDLVTYLSDDILAKVDRASMAVSLEVRVPMLDHRIIAFAWQLPLAYKLGDGEGKRVLRRVLDKYVPRALVERRKMGFSVPLDQWLRGPLRAWAEELLSERALIAGGVLDVARTRAEWDAHLSGRENRQYWLWHALMLQAWLAQEAAA